MKKNKTLIYITVFASLLLLSGCNKINNEAVANDEIIKIGVFEPLTGENALGGQTELEGIQLANELYPTILDKKVELVIVDNKSDKVASANAAVSLVDKEKVNAVIGSWGSSYSIAAGPVFKEASIPVVGASCTSPLVTLGNDYYSRVCYIDTFQGTVMANYAYNELEADQVVIMQQLSSDYSIGLAKYFEEAFISFTSNQNAVIEKVDYESGDIDFSSQLEIIKELDPDVIFVPGNYKEGALIVKQARAFGIDKPFIAADTWESPDFLKMGGEDVEGVVISTFFTTEISITNESEKFIKAYKEKYDKEPTSVAALGYDAYLVILNAIEESGSTDPQIINDFIGQTRNFQGAAGLITLDSNGDAIKNAVIKEVKEGTFKYLTIVEPIE